jgi:hypothetical protein
MNVSIVLRAPPYHIQMASKVIIYRTHLLYYLFLALLVVFFLLFLLLLRLNFTISFKFAPFLFLVNWNRTMLWIVSNKSFVSHFAVAEDRTHPSRGLSVESHLQWQWASSLLLLSLVLQRICVTMAAGAAVMWDVWTFGAFWCCLVVIFKWLKLFFSLRRTS